MKKKYALPTLVVGITMLIMLVRHFDFANLNDIRDQSRKLSQQMLNKYCTANSAGLQNNYINQTQIDISKWYNQVISSRGSNRLYDPLYNNNMQNYVTTLYAYFLPWLILALITIVGFLFCCFYCCCSSCCGRCCPCCKICIGWCIREPADGPPFETKNIAYCLFGVLVFAVLAVAGSVVGVVYTTQLANGLSDSQCSIFKLFDNFENGATVTVNSQTYKWLGLNNIVSSLNTLSASVTQAAQNASSQPINSASLDAPYNTLMTSIDTFYNKDKSLTLANPNPQGTSPQITSDIITNLGPSSNPSTFAGMIKAEMTARATVVYNIIKDVAGFSNTITTQSQTITNSIQSVVSQIGTIQSQVSDAESKVDNAFTQSKTDSNQNIRWGVSGFFAWVFLLAILFVLFGGLYLCFRKKGWRYPIYCVWLFGTWLTVLTFILAAVLMSVGIAGVEGCDIIQRILTNQTEFTKWSTKANEAFVVNQGSICLFGNGSIISTFSGSSQITQVNTVSQEITQLQAINSNFSQYKNSIIIPLLQSNCSSIVAGTTPALTPGSDGSNDPYTILVQFNQLTDYSAQGSQQKGCQVSRDQWVFNTANCTSGYPAGKATDALGNPDCLGVSSSAKADALNRYSSSAYAACTSPVTSANLQSYVNSIYSYFASVGTVFTTISADMNPINTNNVNFMNQAQSLFTPVFNFATSIQALITTATDPNTGIFPQMNCLFIGSGLITFQQTFCNEVVSNLFPIGALLAAVAVLMMFFSLLMFCTGLRISYTGDNSKYQGYTSPGVDPRL